MPKDNFAQIAYLHCLESGVDTLTFAGLSVFSNVLSQKGMIIHRAQYKLTIASVTNLVASADAIDFGLSGSDALSDVSLDDPEVYDNVRVNGQLRGTAANLFIEKQPYVSDFTTLPGGGLLVPADRLFLYTLGTSMPVVSELATRVWFTLIDLAAADYLELAQSMRVLR